MSGWRIGRYLLQRLALLVPLTFLVTLFVFLLSSMVPGGPVAAIVGSHPLSETTIVELRAKLGLNLPLYRQYWNWLSGVLFHFDLGRSYMTGQAVWTAIRSRLGVTLMENIGGILVSLVLGIPLGALAALRRGGALDRVAVGVTVFAANSPSYVLALVLLYGLALKLGWFPIFGAGSSAFGDRLHHLALPIIVLGIGGMALIMRITRAAMLEHLQQDYVLFARARGLSSYRVVVLYAFRNSLLPILTAAGLLLIGVLTGSPFVETVFGLPGLGALLVTSVEQVDVPMIQGLVLVVAIWIVVANILIDLLYALVDPRVGFARAAR
ncbi:MAG TPA: ABC transporter permease [Acidimicrobiales bacterium]|nr:ABC transporter permease [Acidimicrobiales bacterium]